jgi:hypothetical protein
MWIFSFLYPVSKSIVLLAVDYSEFGVDGSRRRIAEVF